jgi:hypothetical protein
LTYLESKKCYGPDKKTLFKKQLFDLEVKGQGPTKVIMVTQWAEPVSLTFHFVLSNLYAPMEGSVLSFLKAE